MPGRIGELAERALRSGVRQGLDRGLGEGSRLFLALGGAAVAVRLLRRMAAPGPATVVRELLQPGETLVIEHLPRD